MNEGERFPGESVVDWVLRLHKRTQLQAKVEQLRARVAELEAENAALRAMVDGALTAAEAMVATLGGCPISLRAKAETHAAACRQALAEGRLRPQYERPSLSDADLTEADLTGANLSGADLSGADLSGADLSEADLWRTDLSGAVLSGADLTDADLTEADLSGADLSGADLRSANLRSAVLTEADLTGADLTGARLAEGVARGRAIGGRAGGYVWWAVALESGDILVQYGCERRLLSWWLTQGPDLSVRHGHPASHWAEGPAVAIAAAVELSQALPAGVRR